MFAFQFTAFLSQRNLTQEKQLRENQLALLQPALSEQQELQGRQRQLRDLITIAQDVRNNRILWSNEINAMLETLPPSGNADQPDIDFDTLNLQALTPPRVDENLYEGQEAIAELSISGTVIDTEVLAQFVRALEDSPNFGVAFQNASRQEDSGFFQYSLTVGSLAGSDHEPQ